MSHSKDTSEDMSGKKNFAIRKKSIGFEE